MSFGIIRIMLFMKVLRMSWFKLFFIKYDIEIIHVGIILKIE